MAKRILAIVLALALSLSLLTVEMFAASLNPTIAKNSNSTAVTVRWSPVTDAAYYMVQLRKDSAPYGNTTRVTPNSDNTNLSQEFNNLPGGTYTATVTAYDRTSGLLEAETTSLGVDIPISGGTTSYKITVSGTTGSIRVSWDAYKPTSSETGTITYEVEYTYKNTSGATQPTLVAYPQNNGTATYVDINIGDNTLTNVTVYYKVGSQTRRSLTSMTASSGGYNTGTGVQIGYDYRGYYIYWNGVGNYNQYTIRYTVGYGQYTGTDYTNTTYYSFTNIASRYPNQPITFMVYASNPYTEVGSVTYYPGYTGGYNPGYGGTYPGYSTGLVVNVNTAAGIANVSWPAVSGASSYTVSYTVGGTPYTKSVNDTQINIYYNGGCSVTVYYTSNGYSYTIGSATIAADGTVTYGGNAYLGGTGTGNSSIITGNNCQLNVGTTTSTITWGAIPNAVNYQIIYTDRSTNRSQMLQNVYTTTATIPYGRSNSTGFDITVLAFTSAGVSSIAASATYSGNLGGTTTNYTESYVDGLTLTQRSSSVTRVTWNAVSGVSYYLVEYARIGDSVSTEQPVSATSFDLPLGKNNGFTIMVTAQLTSGRRTLVGQAVHLAGDDFDNKTQSSTTDKTPEYVTNFKGTSGDKKISLSWNAASGNPTYTVYWKKSSESGWKKLGTTTKRAVTVTGLVNGRSYDFKITANGKDSGILTMAPQASGSVVGTATDPNGSTTTASTVPVITTATGGSGSITVSWNGVSGAQSYQVWVATNGSNTYNHKATVSGTSATIRGLAAGTYKVRVKASKDGKTWPTLAEASSDYVTVTVK